MYKKYDFTKPYKIDNNLNNNCYKILLPLTLFLTWSYMSFSVCSMWTYTNSNKWICNLLFFGQVSDFN